ncbi:hypothetical protein PEC301889_33690 [Pectobacterium carotovorum subsp. carotovorum]|nr:hypothetical protein PEC301889_33690 [Pectobacterium carotovorum subsp. carotovorum]
MAGTDTHYTYDEDGHCIAIRNGEGETRHFLYDGRGLLIKETARDDTLHYRYDAAGRESSRAGGEFIQHRKYDVMGRLTQHDDTHYQYDKAGRLIRKQVVQPGYRPQVWHYRWDSRNQLRVVDTPTGER